MESIRKRGVFNKDIRCQINTGDIILFSGRDNLVSIGIQLMTKSKWFHVGMILKDYKKDIIYLWESTTLSNIKDTIYLKKVCNLFY